MFNFHFFFFSFLSFLTQLACCCGSAACSLCCSACPSCKSSTASRIGYALMLVFSTIVASIMLIPDLRTKLDQVGGYIITIGLSISFFFFFSSYPSHHFEAYRFYLYILIQKFSHLGFGARMLTIGSLISARYWDLVVMVTHWNSYSPETIPMHSVARHIILLGDAMAIIENLFSLAFSDVEILGGTLQTIFHTNYRTAFSGRSS